MKWIRKARGIFFGYLALEVLVWISLCVAMGHLVYPKEFTSEHLRLRYKSSVACSYLESLQSHPFLGYIYRRGADRVCDTEVNNVGVSGPDHPAEKSNTEFTILLTGGSVAEGLLIEKSDEHFVTAELNRRFYPPHPFKNFRVIGAALGDWRMPHQVNATIWFGKVIHAVIDVEGYNEMFSYDAPSYPVAFSPNSSALLEQKGLAQGKSYFTRLLDLAEKHQWMQHFPSVAFALHTHFCLTK